MLKTTIIAVVAAAIGAAAGAALLNYAVQQEMAANNEALRAAKDQGRILASNAAALGKRAEEAERENARIQTELDAARQELAARAEAPPVESVRLTSLEMEAPVPAAPPEPLSEPALAANSETASRNDANMSEPAQEDPVIRKLRDSISQFYEKQIAQTNDPAAQERLASLAEFADRAIELRERISAAPTEEERKDLQQELRVTYLNHDNFLRAERNAQLLHTAELFGISEPSTQDAFVQTMNNTLQNPIFQNNSPLAGGRGGPIPVLNRN